MAFKIIEVAQVGWRAVNAPHLVTLVGAGANFKNKIVERSGDQPATTAALTEPLMAASVEDPTLAGPDGSGMVEGSEADEVEQLGEDRGEQQGAAEDVTAPESEEGVTAEIATVEPDTEEAVETDDDLTEESTTDTTSDSSGTVEARVKAGASDVEKATDHKADGSAAQAARRTRRPRNPRRSRAARRRATEDRRLTARRRRPPTPRRPTATPARSTTRRTTPPRRTRPSSRHARARTWRQSSSPGFQRAQYDQQQPGTDNRRLHRQGGTVLVLVLLVVPCIDLGRCRAVPAQGSVEPDLKRVAVRASQRG
jgi:hypothetical protein